MDKLNKPYTGLYPVYIDPKDGQFASGSRLTFGSLADSFYEYLLKLDVLSGKCLVWLLLAVVCLSEQTYLETITSMEFARCCVLTGKTDKIVLKMYNEAVA